MPEVEKNVDIKMNGDAEVVGQEKTPVETKTKVKKEKKPRAKTAYNYFVSTTMKELPKEKEFEGKKNSDLMKECGIRWKACSDKSPYEKMAEDNKITVPKVI
jgi:hypothetical protein